MAAPWMAASWMVTSDLSLCKTPVGVTVCLDNPYILLTGCLRIQFFDLPPFSQYSQLDHLWLPTPDCAAPV